LILLNPSSAFDVSPVAKGSESGDLSPLSDDDLPDWLKELAFETTEVANADETQEAVDVGGPEITPAELNIERPAVSEVELEAEEPALVEEKKRLPPRSRKN
jgi:hypothetical protein